MVSTRTASDVAKRRRALPREKPSKKKSPIAIALASLALAATLSSAAAQTAPASNDPIVQSPMAQREANRAYTEGLLKAYVERNEKVNKAVEQAVRNADAKGTDPLVAKREAHAQALKATEPEYEARIRALQEQHRAALAQAAALATKK